MTPRCAPLRRWVSGQSRSTPTGCAWRDGYEMGSGIRARDGRGAGDARPCADVLAAAAAWPDRQQGTDGDAHPEGGDVKAVPRKELPTEVWDRFVEQHPEGWFFHTSHW